MEEEEEEGGSDSSTSTSSNPYIISICGGHLATLFWNLSIAPIM